MTIITGGVCKAVIYAGGGVIPAAVGSVIGASTMGAHIFVKAGAIIDATTGAIASGTIAAMAGAIGAGTSAGAISGAIVTQTSRGALTGAVVGGMSATSLSSVLAGTVGLTSAGFTAGPLGLLCVGTGRDMCSNQATYDCWKPVVHDPCTEPSSGMLLKDLCTHPCISTVSITAGGVSDLPDILLENIWNEKFKIEYFLLPENNKIVCHANLL